MKRGATADNIRRSERWLHQIAVNLLGKEADSTGRLDVWKAIEALQGYLWEPFKNR